MDKDKLSTAISPALKKEDELPAPSIEQHPLKSYLFGYDGHLRNNLFVLRDEKQSAPTKIVYTAGHNVVFYEFKDMKDSKDNKQSYILGTVGTKGITCIQISPSKRFLAFAEEAEYGIINIYELKGKGGDKAGNFLETPIKRKTLVFVKIILDDDSNQIIEVHCAQFSEQF